MNVIETRGVGKRYGDSWALHDCTLTIPAGCLAALVGPNGAGKTTLMSMSVGLTVPTEGTAIVLGDQLPGSPAALDGIAFVAQDSPVYKNLSAADMLHLTRNLNRRFDQGHKHRSGHQLAQAPARASMVTTVPARRRATSGNDAGGCGHRPGMAAPPVCHR